MSDDIPRIRVWPREFLPPLIVVQSWFWINVITASSAKSRLLLRIGKEASLISTSVCSPFLTVPKLRISTILVIQW